jgi:hypothetical protein
MPQVSYSQKEKRKRKAGEYGSTTDCPTTHKTLLVLFPTSGKLMAPGK